MEKWKEYEEEFPVKNFGARKVKEERKLSARQKQPLLLEMMRGNEMHLKKKEDACLSKTWRVCFHHSHKTGKANPDSQGLMFKKLYFFTFSFKDFEL